MADIQHNEPLREPAAAEVVHAGVDFDRSEPQASLITGLGLAAIIGLVAVILGVQAYFNHIEAVATYEKVEVPVADDLKSLHAQEAEELNTYKYIDRNKGVVQIPVSRAMDLIVQEAAANKLKYFRKPTPVKDPNATGPAGTGPTQDNKTGGANGAAPAGTAGQPVAAGSSIGTNSAPGSKGNK